MSSHREAPEISKDPVADSTDLYAFVSPDRPDSVTIIANYIPLEAPAGGPNFYEFGDDVIYQIKIDNDGDGRVDIPYEFIFTTTVAEPEHVPLQRRADPDARRRQLEPPQFYKVVRTDVRKGNKRAGAGQRPRLPAVQHRPAVDARLRRHSPTAAIHDLPGDAQGVRRAAGRGLLRRPRLHLRPRHPASGAEAAQPLRARVRAGARRIGAGRQHDLSVNVHTIALQVPDDRPHPRRQGADRSRQPEVRGRHLDGGQAPQGGRAPRRPHRRGPQPSPWSRGRSSRCRASATRLFNEVLVPMTRKDYWNLQPPYNDSEFADGVAHPELAALLPVLYPGVFPNLAALERSRASPAPTCWPSSSRASRRASCPASRTSWPPRRPTCCASTWPSRRRRRPTTSASSAATRPASPTGGGSSTTWSPSSYGPSPAPPTRSSTRRSRPMPPCPPSTRASRRAPTDLKAKGTENYLDAFPYLGEPYQRLLDAGGTPA